MHLNMTAQSITINEVERASFRLRQKILEMEMAKLRIDEAYKKKYLIPRVRAIDYWLGTKYLHHIKWAASLEPSKNLSPEGNDADRPWRRDRMDRIVGKGGWHRDRHL